MLRNTFGVIGLLRWLVPFIMLGIGYQVPALRTPVEWPETNALWAALFVSLGVMAVWLIAEIVTVVHRHTTSRQLQVDAFLSLMVALVITYIAGRQGADLQWFVVIPWLGSVLDAMLLDAATLAELDEVLAGLRPGRHAGRVPGHQQRRPEALRAA